MSNHELSGRRVFIVEDESLVAMMMEAMVEELGATVIGSEGRVGEALDFIAARHSEIDIVVLDLNLGGTRGYAVANAVTGLGIPFVFSTGYQDGDIVEEWRDRPMLSKPFQLSELRGALAQALLKP
ncbi:response regulator [Ancylobacter mangrovi]|uniref:Response regulator n=1 Tax=Ancylobacter mangrovi TaxID=2972472 RepID=A0A9X2PDZ9_9HYPH|nr:response regulator [Ancylobacter mangrovi]MCS0494235.1 response regulator [Ancylobacter mangrovi]MCS0501038.1 response regulator [Ancylobacter mangrovi]